MRDDRRLILESRITAGRPVGAEAASWMTFLIGTVAAYATFKALAPLPHGAFAVFKPVAVLSSCAAVAIVGFSLQLGLLTGRLWSWFGAFNWALLCGALPALMLGHRIRGGLSLRIAIALAPPHAALVVLSLALLALLCLGGTREWFASAHRLRSLSPEGLDRYLADPARPL